MISPVAMHMCNVDVGFVDTDYTDEFGLGWKIHAEKHNNVQGHEANLTCLYRHAGTGYEVYFFNTLATPNGQVTIITRKPQ